MCHPFKSKCVFWTLVSHTLLTCVFVKVVPALCNMSTCFRMTARRLPHVPGHVCKHSAMFETFEIQWNGIYYNNLANFCVFIFRCASASIRSGPTFDEEGLSTSQHINVFEQNVVVSIGFSAGVVGQNRDQQEFCSVSSTQ